MSSSRSHEPRAGRTSRAHHTAGGVGWGAAHSPAVPRHPIRERLLDGADAVLRRIGPRFTLDGDSYRYAVHAYNRTIRNERCVELPVASARVRAAAFGRVLEVGNVLGHYIDHEHTVIDKYEIAPGVRNVDVVDYRPEVPFDLVVAVSTLEHVGWDEEPRQPAKLGHACAHLLAHCVAAGGSLWVTLPLGYNAWLDAALQAHDLPFQHLSFMRRTGRFVAWRQCEAREAFGARYGTPYPFANAVCFAEARQV